MNLSFAGCGFLGIYHVGVAVCFKKYAPQLLLGKISGASFGALSACCLLCDVPIGEITSDVLRVVGEARAGSLGPFSPSFNIQNVLLEGMDKYLPHDVHKIVSGKLHISLTRVYDGKNVIVSEFHGIRYMDGGFSDNLPILNENTVNVANTSIELSKQNITRLGRILFPPKPEVLSNMCKQGFDDALRFLHRNNMISCTRCLAVQSTFQLQEVLSDTVYDYDLDCEECKTHRQHALVDDLPDTVMTIFQNAIDSANHGIVNWVMRQRAVRYVGDTVEKHSVQYNVAGNMFVLRKKCIRHNNTMTSGIITCMNGRKLVHENLDLVNASQRALLNVTKALMNQTFVACTPKMSRSLWKISLNMLQQLHGFMKMTEIYDVTDADTEAVQSPTERDVNKQLEFDNDWSSGMIADIDELVTDELDGLDEDELGDRNLFSDPESEWRRDSLTNSESDGEQPESDQRMPNPFLSSKNFKHFFINVRIIFEDVTCSFYFKNFNYALLANNSLRHVFLPRCLVGDAGCLAICKAVRCMPNILTLDLSGCELTPLGASYIADLLKYQKIHRYSENWVHTLRYRLPDLDQMAGLRRVSVCGNPLGDAGAAALLTVLADDLWIKAMDLQNCELTESTAQTVLQMMESNTTLVVLDLRHNPAIASESLGKVRGALRRNETGGVGGQYSWLSSVSVGSGDGRSVKPIASNQCQHEIVQKKEVDPIAEELSDVTEKDELEANELHVNIMPKKAQSTHMKLTDNGKMNKMTKSAHLLGQIQHIRESMQMKPEMFEKQIGDVKSIHTDEQSLDEVVGNQVKSKKNSTRSRSSSSVSDSSDTLVSPCARGPPAVNPRDVLCSSSDDDSS
ncbi:hypothetical protein MSG28_001811 [Choristoneura fumiferana]|uniref:Uncharacterized protein n=1 Tax=Choristoneura fumiferana TaxID=7141 RepID=A0ACC0KWA3_CHOFU|nr:hypothetical protein MSG28_001811 [Choristoneura fumiferana]